jgi:hypothetical protein
VRRVDKRKSDAINGKAPEMMVTSRDWTENGRTSPAMSFHRYRLTTFFSSLQIGHGVVIVDVGFELSFSVVWLWPCLSVGRGDSSKGASELWLIIR